MTDKEFREAMAMFAKKEDYWCDRLEVLLNCSHGNIMTPRDELGRGEILVDISLGWPRRLFQDKDGRYYEILPGGLVMEQKFRDEGQKQLFLKGLASQENFYDKGDGRLLKAPERKKIL